MHSISRRQFLNSLTRFGVAALAVGQTPGAFADNLATAGEQHVQQTLAKLAFRLFPHDGLAMDSYREIANSLLARAEKDQALTALLEAGVDTLDNGGSVSWLGLSEQEQLHEMTRIEGSGFFRLLRSTTIEHLYRNKVVWQLLGYEGSSLEFGGYVERGFDDIDWLPGDQDRP